MLPNKLLLGDQVFSDTRDINLSLAFFHRYAASPDLKATNEPCPADAIAAGADHIVVGRPVWQAADPRRAALGILDELGPR